MSSSDSNCLYVYAIIPGAEKIIFDVPGDDRQDNPVYTIPYQKLASSTDPIPGSSTQAGISAVVSLAPFGDIRGLQRSEAAVILIKHQQVIECLMQAGPLLPLKFGTILNDEAQVVLMLAQGEDTFRTALTRFGGLVQMEVVVLWKVQKIFAEIGLEEAVVQARQQIATCAPEDSLNHKIALGQMVQAGLERRRSALQAEILPALSAVARDIITNSLMDDTMVMNVALLLDQVGVQALDETLDNLDAELTSRDDLDGLQLNFRRVGPLAPYSFATIRVQIPDYDLVAAACKRFDLAERATLEEIKRAYHHQVIQVHPDLHPERVDVQEVMAELNTAYRLLTACAESQGLPPASPCGFDQETINHTLIIHIQQQSAAA